MISTPTDKDSKIVEHGQYRCVKQTHNDSFDCQAAIIPLSVIFQITVISIYKSLSKNIFPVYPANCLHFQIS